MRRDPSSGSITLNVWAVIKKRIYLIFLSLPGFFLLSIGGYYIAMPIRNNNLHTHNLGMSLALLGILYLIIVFSISAVRTFKKWEIVKKQKSYLQHQHYPLVNKALFVILVVVIFGAVYFRGVRGYYELTDLFSLALVLAILWSLFVFVKKRLGGKK